MCLVGVEKNCPGENFAAAVGARGVDGLDVAHEQAYGRTGSRHFTFGPNDLRCGVLLDCVVSGDRGAGGLEDDPAPDFHGVVGEPFVVAA